MIKTAVVGLWVCAVTIGAGYFGTTWQTDSPAEAGKSLDKMTQVKVKPVSVPIVAGGKVTGYVVAQFTYIASAEALKKLAVKPDAFLLDAAYKGMYAGREIEPTKLDKENWSGLAKTVKDTVNARYGSEVLQDVLLDDFGYVQAGAARRGLETGPGPKGSEKGGADKKASSGH